MSEGLETVHLHSCAIRDIPDENPTTMINRQLGIRQKQGGIINHRCCSDETS